MTYSTMEYTFDIDTLKNLLSALREQTQAPNFSASEKLTKRIIAKGWAFNSDVEDLIYHHDSRLGAYQIDLKKIAALMGIHWETVCFRPKSNSKSVCEFDAIRCEDAALFLILLERLGFQTNPDYFVEQLLPSLKSRKKELLNNAELEIFWYRTTKSKCAPLTLKNGQDWRKTKELDSFKTLAGYTITVRGIGSEPDEIEIRSPKYRRQAATTRIICKVCGVEWSKGDPDSSAAHRKEHKKRLLYLDPQPVKEMCIELSEGTEPELVTSLSPAWKHREMYLRAVAFRREFHYDFVQWQSAKGISDPKARGYLFVNDKKIIVGACSFRYQESKSKQKFWALDWAWICPTERRNGHWSKRWPYFRKQYGDFLVTYPVSDQMKSFLEKKGELHLMNVPD